jgi:nucleoside-diphosphate-sugar epimerase
MALVILGCGYVGSRIARAALAEGRTVRVCSRSTGRLQPLGELGAQVKFLDATTPKSFTAALGGMSGATVVYSIPPVTTLPPRHAMRAALQAAYGGGATCFIYFSSCGLYGDSPDDDTWVDEDTPVTPDAAMQNVEADELEIQASSFERLRTVILRLAPVYGPGRGVRERMKKGSYSILEDGQHVTSRIYIDDVVRIVAAAEQHAPNKAIYLVGDDQPVTQGEYAKWLSERLGVAMPPSRQIVEPGKARVPHRNRRIRNARMKRELQLELKCPTFREGEAAIEVELG